MVARSQLDLSFNELSGRIPPELSALVTLTYGQVLLLECMLLFALILDCADSHLNLSHNHFEGDIPIEIVDLESLA